MNDILFLSCVIYDRISTDANNSTEVLSGLIDTAQGHDKPVFTITYQAHKGFRFQAVMKLVILIWNVVV